MSQWNSLWGNDPPFFSPKYRDLVCQLLHDYVPDRNAWIFGSRATGKYLRRFSDLDLAVEGQLACGVRGDLLEAFDQSDIPVKVDLIELGSVDAAFAERIRGYFVVLQQANNRGNDTPAQHQRQVE